MTYQEFAFGTGYVKPPVIKRPTGPFAIQKAKGGVIPSRSSESGYIGSGFINAPTQEGVPALLHGGEYIVNAKAVARLGIGALEKLNNNLIPRFAKGGYVAPKKGGIPFGGEDKILANSTKKAPQALQGPYATSIPVVASPTINLKTLPLVKNKLPGEGGISTVRSASFGVGKGEVLIPTVVQGKILSDTNAFNAYANGGYKNHLGIYANTAAANKAAEVIHLSEANRVNKLLSEKKYDYKTDATLNPIQKGIFKASNIAIGAGKFGLGAASALSQNALRIGMSLFNMVGAVTDVVKPGSSKNPLTNLMTRQDDLYYGTGMSVPFVPRKYGQLTDVGTPVNVMFNQISEYEKLSGTKIPSWKKLLVSVGGDPAISDAIGIGTMGGGSLANAAVKTALLKTVNSTVGRVGLSMALGEGGAMALSGKISQSAALAASNRASAVFQNKNLLGRVQSGAAKVTGRDIAPVAPELIGLNRLYDPTSAIKSTYGKSPSTIIADVLSGRMSFPEGGFGPKAGSIGAGSFIDATVVGEASAATSGGLSMLRNTIADFQVAKSLIGSPAENLSAGINKSVLSSIGGKAAQGIKTFGSAFSNLGSNIKYSGAVQSTLNAGSLTLAGLSGKKGLEYGLMATGLKPAPLGISSAQLRSTDFLNRITPYTKGQSLFDIARSTPGILKSVSNQFNSSAILPGSSQTGMIDSYMDILRGGTGFGSLDQRSMLIESGLRSRVGASDNSYARYLLTQDLEAMLQTYYGSNLYSARFGQVNPLVTSGRMISETISDFGLRGLPLNASLLRENALKLFMNEFDSKGLAFNTTEFSGYSFNTSLANMITNPAEQQREMAGSLRGVFRNIQNTFTSYPAAAEDMLMGLIGTNADTESRFANQIPMDDTRSLPYMRLFGDGSYMENRFSTGVMQSPSISQIQKLARQYLLTSNMTDMPDIMRMVKGITETEFASATPGRDLQSYIGAASPAIPNSSSLAPYRSSLYLKSRLPIESMVQAGGSLGTLNQLTVFDQIYGNLFESYRSTLGKLQGIGTDDESFPLWSPTWEQFEIAWEQMLNEFIESAVATSASGSGASFTGQYLMSNNLIDAEKHILGLVGANISDTWSGQSGGLMGGMRNLGLSYTDRQTGRLSFDELYEGRQSGGWFYGLREGRGIQADTGFSPAFDIDEIITEITTRNMRNQQATFHAVNPAGMLTPTNPQYTGGSSIGRTYRQLTENALRQLTEGPYTNAVPFDKFKLSEFYLNNASDLGSTLMFEKEGKIQAMLDEASSAARIPDEFIQLIDDMFGEGEDDSFISAVWKDWFKTKGTLFRASPDPEDFALSTYTQSPFDSKLYQTLTQNSDIARLFDNRSGYGLNIGAEIENGVIVSRNVNDKYDKTLYHLAHRLVPEVKAALVYKTQDYDILDHPVVKGLTGNDLLRSRQFADLLKLPYSYQIPDSPLDNIAADIFSNFGNLNYVATSGLYSYELPLSPKEHEWVARFAEKMLASPLDLTSRVRLPDTELNAGRYSGLGMPGAPSTFAQPTFNDGLRATEQWLFSLVSDVMQGTSGQGTPIMRERMGFFNSLNEFLNNKTVSGMYGRYFSTPQLRNDPELMGIFNLINDSANATNMEVLGKETMGFPNTMGTASFALRTSMNAANILQSHKMATANVAALY